MLRKPCRPWPFPAPAFRLLETDSSISRRPGNGVARVGTSVARCRTPPGSRLLKWDYATSIPHVVATHGAGGALMRDGSGQCCSAHFSMGKAQAADASGMAKRAKRRDSSLKISGRASGHKRESASRRGKALRPAWSPRRGRCGAGALFAPSRHSRRASATTEFRRSPTADTPSWTRPCVDSVMQMCSRIATFLFSGFIKAALHPQAIASRKSRRKQGRRTRRKRARDAQSAQAAQSALDAARSAKSEP